MRSAPQGLLTLTPPSPALHAIDLSFGPGKIGVGSFDETGEFQNTKIAAIP